MTIHIQLLNAGELLLLYDGLKPPELHLAVMRASERCDSCSLQAHCTQLFGVRGENCKIHGKGQSWACIPAAAIKLIKDV